VAGRQEIQVPRRGSQPARLARLQVRFAPVRLQPPHGKERRGGLALGAVLAQEVEAPCTVYFEEAEWKALLAYVTQTPTPPDQPPSGSLLRTIKSEPHEP
jgi:hypothetical protein